LFVDETALIVAARKAGVKYIVKLSTYIQYIEIYSTSFYGRTHLAIEQFLEQGDIPFTSIRPHLFFNWLGFGLQYR
jgi:hypothetical protein